MGVCEETAAALAIGVAGTKDVLPAPEDAAVLPPLPAGPPPPPSSPVPGAPTPLAGLPPGGTGMSDDDEAFYEAHRARLLERLRSDGPVRLQARGEGGVGLLNQGATCYMNSLLQALFNTPEFTLMLYHFRHDPAVHGEASRSIPLQLQRLFAQLQLSAASAASTKDLTVACGLTGRDAMEQHDVQELCRVLFDALELSALSLAEEIHRLFAGTVVHWIRSKEEHLGRVYESRRAEKFLDLQVPIQDCRTLEEALCGLLASEALEGDNQWHCEDLGMKVDALKGTSYERIPQILCLQLMRFVFDCATMRRKKLTDALSIPVLVDLGFLLGSQACPLWYELAAVCLHNGTAHGGHYHAFLREPHSGAWRDANDSVVRMMGPEQVRNLFRPRGDGAAGPEGEPPEGVGGGGEEEANAQLPPPSLPPGQCALHSSDAYFLLYRRVGEGAAPQVRDEDVPDALREEILAENAQLGVLQRAYALHRALLEVKIFAPSAVHLAVRRHAALQLDGLLSGPHAESTPEPQSVTVTVPDTRSPTHVLVKALAAFAAEARAGSEAWAWARGLDTNGHAHLARLRKYDPWCGEPRAPLVAPQDCADQLTIGALVDRGSPGSVALLLELQKPEGGFEPWEEGRWRTIVCRWDEEVGCPSVVPQEMLALRLPPGADAAEPEAAADAASETAPGTAAESAGLPAFEPDSEEPPGDLFASEPVATCVPQSSADTSPLLGDVREAVAAAWGVSPASAVALVALSGARAGQALQDDRRTLQACGLNGGDVICAEVMPENGEAPRAVQLFDRKKNTARLAFNHPDRPQYPEEHGPLEISKDATVAELKRRIGEVLGLSAADLHLCRAQKCAQIKDETKTLRQACLSELSTVFVGHGAPCSPDESVLKVALYTRDKDSHKAKEAFSLAARGNGTVRNLREALVEPLAKWHAEVTAPKEDGTSAEAPFPLEGLSWRRLRLRDGQAGKQFAVLRDEKPLRTALMGFADGRQVAVQVLDFDEELLPEDVILAVRPWRVREGRLHAPTEVVASRTMSLRDFRAMLTVRFAGLLQQDAASVPEGEAGGEAAAEAEGGAERRPFKPFSSTGYKLEDSVQAGGALPEPEPEAVGEAPVLPPHGVDRQHPQDALEVFALPSVGPPVSIKRCESLKWSESRISASASDDALGKPLSEFKEVRDGVTLIIRSKLAAALGPLEPTASQPAAASAKGKAKAAGPTRPAPRGAAAAPKAGAVATCSGPPERGLVIRVAHPEGFIPAPPAPLPSPDTSPSADGGP